MKAYGSQSMVEPLRKVLVRRPDASFAVADPAKWGYAGTPDLRRAQDQHDAFVRILGNEGIEVLPHDAPQAGRADAIFVHDPAIVTDEGAIVLRMGKELRRGEEASLSQRLEELGVPILSSLKGAAVAEGGDLLWLDHDTIAIGQGFRTNAEAIEQLRKVMERIRVSVVPVPLPYHHGPAACLHLMSLVSLVDVDLAVAYPRLLPVAFWQSMKDRGFEFLEVPEEEFATLGANILAVSPRRCLMLEGNPRTRQRLEDAGYRVATYGGSEICLKAEGGPTCLTRPILRQ